MNGLLHLLERTGQSLALLEQRCAELEAENAQLRQALADATRDAQSPASTQGAP